jgi:hypothetical protein
MRDGAVSDVDGEIIGRIARASLRHEQKVPGPVVRRAGMCDRYEGDQATRGYCLDETVLSMRLANLSAAYARCGMHC